MCSRSIFVSTCIALLTFSANAPAASDAAANYDESKIAPYTLTDQFLLADGSKLTTDVERETLRRTELLEIFSREVDGSSPPKPASMTFRVKSSAAAAMGGDGAADAWADPHGSYLSLAEASKAWALFGKSTPGHEVMPSVGEMRMDGPLAYHLRAAGHDLTEGDSKLDLDQADQLFSRANLKD